MLLAPVAAHVCDGEPGKYLRQHGKVRAQSGAHRPSTRSSGYQHTHSANLLLISPHRPPVALPFQSRDRPITQERSSAALGELDGREHGALAAYVTALRIEQGDVTLANQVLGQAPLCLLSRHHFERKTPLPARSQQSRMIRVVVIHDGHHAGDLQEGGPAVRFQLAPQVAGALQQGRVMPPLGIHHAEHPGLTRVRRERPRDRKPVDANYPQPA